MVQAEKRRRDLKGGSTAAAGAAPQPPVEVSAEEYPGLLKSLYQRTDLTKPRNAIGLAKDLPGAEMEALLLDHIQVSDDAARNLAVQRGVSVRDYLAAHQVPLDRLFVGAPKTQPHEAGWTPRADLELATP
jgi:hypothetical protein